MELPALDCHAHISVNVTERELRELGPAIIFAMTRSPSEAFEATLRYDENVLWACGAHPSNVARGEPVDIEQFARRAKRFAVVGEIGLDRRSGNMAHQESVFEALLEKLAGEPVLLSVHSAGASAEVIRIVERHRHNGLIMHWFTGSRPQVETLLALGCYFSINSAMSGTLLKFLPLDRILPETDFPVARRRTGLRPGDTSELEVGLAEAFGLTASDVRRQFYRNLRRISVSSGAIDRLPTRIADLLLKA